MEKKKHKFCKNFFENNVDFGLLASGTAFKANSSQEKYYIYVNI